MSLKYSLKSETSLSVVQYLKRSWSKNVSEDFGPLSRKTQLMTLNRGHI